MNQFLVNFTSQELKRFHHKLHPGKRVRLIRKKLNSTTETKGNYSLTKIADKINIHASTLSRFENQNTNLKLTSFIHLAQYLDFSLELILKGRLIYKNPKFKPETLKKLKSLSDYNQRIKYLQQKFNLNTKKLEEYSLTVSTLNKIINKKVEPKIKTITQIANIFEINLDLLIYGYYPTNQIPVLITHQENLKDLNTEFPTRINVLKGMLLQQNYQKDLKEKFMQIIASLTEILNLLPKQLKLEKLVVHDFQSKLDKINKIYQPLNSIINLLDDIIKNFSPAIKSSTKKLNLLIKIRDKIRESKLTLDGLNFHQQNKPMDLEKSLTIYSTISQPLAGVKQKLKELKTDLKKNKESTKSSNTTNNSQQNSNTNHKLNHHLENNYSLKNKNINNSDSKLKSKPNIKANVTTETKVNNSQIDPQINFQKTTDLKELYSQVNNQLEKLKTQLQKYISTSHNPIRTEPQKCWQLYDLLQLELESFWNKNLILKENPEKNKKIELKFKTLLLHLTNLLNPLNRLLKVLTGEINSQEYYINYLFNLLKQELLNLPTAPKVLTTDLLENIENKTKKFVNSV